ncbi:hypothetical protein A20C1_04756 [marine actinobacterium PHSC20C1]|nr:hypothetical protein A20C1_04756 [marine actinobacterium PHSC20C1]
MEDDIIDYAEGRFEIRPYPKYRDLMQITDLVNQLGYNFPFSQKQYSLEDVQEKLRSEGAQAFLRLVRVQEDISPKAPFKKAGDFVAERLALLSPSSDLIIVDPYLFPPNPKVGEDEYSEFLASLIAPILEPGANVICIVNTHSNKAVESAVAGHLEHLVPGVTVEIHQSDDFHDRFWISGRSQGVVVGASFNGLGRKLFFIDTLEQSDVDSIVAELAALGI